MASPAVRQLLLSGRGTAFTPLSLPGLVAWYDFSDLSTLFQNSTRTTPAAADGDPLGGVTDKSGNGYHHSQGTSSKKPALKLATQNGRPVGLTDGVDDFLRSPAFAAAVSQPYTIAAAFKLVFPATGFKVFIEWTVTGGGTAYLETQNNSGIQTYLGSLEVPIPLTAAAFNLLMTVPNGAATAYRVNGGARTTLGSSPGTNPATGLTLGSVGNGTTAFCPVNVGEVVIASGSISAADEQKLFSYLNARWAAY